MGLKGEEEHTLFAYEGCRVVERDHIIRLLRPILPVLYYTLFICIVVVILKRLQLSYYVLLESLNLFVIIFFLILVEKNMSSFIVG